MLWEMSTAPANRTTARLLRSRPIGPYDAGVAAHVAELSRLVYQPRQQVLSAADRFGYERAVWIENRATQGVVFACPWAVTRIWRGSLGLRDWIHDFLAFRVRWRGVLEGRVHYGFKRELRAVEEQAVDVAQVMLTRYRDAKLVNGGHSLGGDIAALDVALMAARGIPFDASYPLEMARAGNRRFADCVVVVHPRGEMDLVTRVPPSAFGWAHIGGHPEIHWRSQRFTSRETWQAYRASRPLSPWAALRVVSKLKRSVLAHLSKLVERTLLEQAVREGIELV